MSDVEELAITAKDRCDKCGAQAYFMPILDSGDLLFCRHHFMENKEILEEISYHIVDQSGVLENRQEEVFFSG